MGFESEGGAWLYFEGVRPTGSRSMRSDGPRRGPGLVAAPLQSWLLSLACRTFGICIRRSVEDRGAEALHRCSEPTPSSLSSEPCGHRGQHLLPFFWAPLPGSRCPPRRKAEKTSTSVEDCALPGNPGPRWSCHSCYAGKERLVSDFALSDRLTYAIAGS